MRREFFAALAIGSAAALAPTAWAESRVAEGTGKTSGPETFDQNFFAQFSPQSALDMVSRVPGFSIDEGADRRGFSGAAGNVLIDGARPSAKSEGIRDILSRIPASRVQRIELNRASTTGEAAGQSVVVNVVRVAGAGGLSGTYELDLQHSNDERIEVRGSGSVTKRFGATELTLGGQRYIEDRPLRGRRFLSDAAGVATGTRDDYTPRTFREAKGNVGLATPLWGGTLHVNGSGGRWNFATNLESVGRGIDGGVTDSFTLSIDERERRRELGADYEHKFGPFTVKAIGLDTRRWYANDEGTLTRDNAGAGTDLFVQKTRKASVETIGRLSATWAISRSHRLEFGGEAALNTLDTRVDLTDNGVPQDLQASNVRVEEERSEAFATWTWTPSPKWTLESTLTTETSTISQSGDTRSSRTLSYLKPSVQLSRKLNTRDQAKLRLFRDVSQLNFSDFASSAQLGDNRVAAGNPDLRPQTLWRLEGVYDKRFGSKGAVTLTLSHDWIEDASDSIPILDASSVPPGCTPPACPKLPSFFDAPGNIGEGSANNAEIKATLPLDAVLKGAQFETRISYVDTQVTDPTTGLKRPISQNADLFMTASFRQDLTAQKASWGIDYEKPSERRFFRVSERETYEEGPFVSAFAETTRFGKIKIRFEADNLLNTTFRRERRFFAPNRAGAFDNEELRKRHFGQLYAVTVSGNF